MAKEEASISWKTRGEIGGIYIPPQEALDYVLKHETLDFKGLALHMLTAAVVANALISEINNRNNQLGKDKRIQIDKDVILSSMIATHAPRPLAVAGVKGESTEFINDYMKTHDDIELAEMVAVEESLPKPIIIVLDELQKSKGFPRHTIGPDNPKRLGTIDWNAAINQIASWSVAGPIVPLEERYQDLIERHAKVPDSPKKLTKEDLKGYRDWMQDRINDLSDFFEIDPKDFHNFLRSMIQADYPKDKARVLSDNLIRELFERDPKPDEFLPVSSAFKYLAESISNIEEPEIIIEDGEKIVVPNPRRRILEQLFAKPDRFLHLCKVYGVIKEDISINLS